MIAPSTSAAVRADGRLVGQLRPVRFQNGIAPHATGSTLIEWGHTRVICGVTVEESVPRWMKEQGVTGGWITAEYSMLPYSTLTRKQRDISKGKIDGRSQEIQRLIGRSLRAAIDLERLGPRTVWLDCDVLQADGGTRTAAITGSFVALSLAIRALTAAGKLADGPFSTRWRRSASASSPPSLCLTCPTAKTWRRGGHESGDERGRPIHRAARQRRGIRLHRRPTGRHAGPGENRVPAIARPATGRPRLTGRFHCGFTILNSRRGFRGSRPAIAGWAFLAQDFLPELARIGLENQIHSRRMRQPVVPRHFLVQLAGRPARVAGKQPQLLRCGIRFPQIHQRLDGVPEVDMGHHVGVRHEEVRMQKAQDAGLHRPANVKRLLLDGLRQIGNHRVADFAAGRP